MNQTESIGREEELGIERQVSSFVHDLERRTNRSAKLGCFWLMFVGLGALGLRRTSGFAIWGFLTFASFLALGFFLRNQTRRSVDEFQRLFRGTAHDAHRREVALHHLWTLAHPPHGTPNKTAQKMLDGLGLSARPATPVVRSITDDGTRPPFPGQEPPVVATHVNTPIVMTLPPSGSSHSSTSMQASSPRSTRPPQPNPSRAFPAPSASHTAPTPSAPHTASEPTSAHAPRPERAPIAEAHSPPAPSVLGPPPSSQEKRVPATTSAPRLDDLVIWRCDACGMEARVPRTEAHRLCPTCFPQIRLDV